MNETQLIVRDGGSLIHSAFDNQIGERYCYLEANYSSGRWNGAAVSTREERVDYCIRLDY
jgi:hypothetical protein